MSYQSSGFFRAGLLSLLFTLLAACGGSDNDVPRGALNDPDVSLSNIEVEGYDIQFSPGKTGPYEIQVANAVTTLTVTPTVGRADLMINTNQTSTLYDVISSDFEDMVSGQSFTYDLAEGTNVIVIRAYDDAIRQVTAYTLFVNRVSASASLIALQVGNFLAADTTESLFPLNETFEPGTFDYTVTLPYVNCSTWVTPYTNNRSTQAEIVTPTKTVSPAISSDPINLNVDVGDTLVTTNLVSEDGNNSAQYNLTITRQAGTAAEIAANSRLASLTFTPGDFNFYCGQVIYSNIFVNNNVTEIDIVANPENPNSTVTVNEQSYVNGDVMTLSLDSDGVTVVEIEVTSEDASSTTTYALQVLTRSRNVVAVDTTEDFQDALKTAMPNDEIRLAPGTYTGVASLADSGNLNAHFASGQNGTAQQRIYIFPANLTQDTVLSGSDTQQNAVMQLEGDFWVVYGLKIENARNGIVLDGASNTIIQNVEVSNTGAQGIVIRNGSSNNVVVESRFGTTGVDLPPAEVGLAEAILIGSDDSDWLDNPDLAGPYEEADNNNAVRSSLFTDGVASEAIEVNEGAVGTLIEFNTFESGGLTAQAGDTSLIRIEGNETVVRYNSFYHEDDDNLSAAIIIGEASEAWHSEDWGENSEIYQNEFLFNEIDLPVVQATSVSTYVLENVREDDAEPEYAGSGFDENFEAPLIQIQPELDQSLCVTSDQVEVTAGIFASIATLQTCVDGDASMMWKRIVDGDGYIRLQSAEDSSRYLYPISRFVQGCGENPLDSVVRVNFLGQEGAIYNWRFRYEDDDLLLQNKSNTNFQLTTPVDENGDLQANTLVLMCARTGSDIQRFRAVEVSN